LKLLIQFQKKHEDTEQKIKDALGKGDIELARRLIHTVKGVSGNIGAKDLYLSSVELGQNLKQENRDNIQLLLERFETSLAQIKDGICGLEFKQEAAKTESKSKEEIPMDFDKARSIINDLPNLLETNYMKAIDQLNILREHLPNPSAIDEYKQLEKHVDEFDFEEAYVSLEKIVKTL